MTSILNSMTMKIHLWKKKSLSCRTDLKGSEKIIFIVGWCNYWFIFYFLSTLYLMFDYLWACISLSDIHHICAKSNGHTLGFISLWLLCSIWPTDHGFTVPTLSWFSFILHDCSFSASTVNPLYSSCSLCRPQQKGLPTPNHHTSLPSLLRGAFCPWGPPIMMEPL